jgi:hypothetical protein
MRKSPLLVLAAAGVAASGALARPSATPTTTSIDYGKSVTLTATAPQGAEGATSAMILGKPCAITKFVTVATPPLRNGKLSFTIGPTMNTIYRVLIFDRPVVTLNVRVRPVIKLERGAGGRFGVTVVTGNGMGLGGKKIVLERQRGKRWRAVRTVRLKLTSSPGQIDAVAQGSAVVGGSGPVRAVLTAAQAKPCFAPATSPTA